MKTIDQSLAMHTAELLLEKTSRYKPYKINFPLSDKYEISYPGRSLKKTVRRFFFKALLQHRAHRLTPRILNALSGCTTLLDLGCGDMILTESLHQQSDIQLTAVDTVDTNLSHLPVFLYNGNTIPFPDNTFDATMVAYVLHHCSDITAVLREIKRVTSKRIIIMEEVYKGRVAEKILHLHDSGNRFLSTKMKIPCNFMKIEQWHEAFVALNLTVRTSERIYQYPTMNVTHQVFFELDV